MNIHREYIIELCKKNEATRKINMNTLDACVRLYDSKPPLAEVYEKIAMFPVPFLVFLTKCLEIQREVIEDRENALRKLLQNNSI